MVDTGEAQRKGQEGSRWINERPSGEEVASWFEENVPLHEGLQAANYVQGITLIPNIEKAQTVISWDSDNNPLIAKKENLVFTPYAKVETRVKYFHDLMAQHPDWTGFIEPVVPQEQSPKLPPGFFPFAIKTSETTIVSYVCCSMKVTVYEGEIEHKSIIDRHTGAEISVRRIGKIVIDGPPATKMIATLSYNKADNFALMKAETGAVGRALGMAGMLVIPGTGVATAEDLQEAEALAERPPTPAEETAPPAEVVPPEQVLSELRHRAGEVIGQMKTAHPEVYKNFVEWAKGREIEAIGDIKDERVLRGVLTKAERELAEATSEKPGE